VTDVSGAGKTTVGAAVAERLGLLKPRNHPKHRQHHLAAVSCRANTGIAMQVKPGTDILIRSN
jgi:hypothetical protein